MKKFTIDVQRTGKDDEECSKSCPQLHKEPRMLGEECRKGYCCALDNSVLQEVTLYGNDLHLFCTATCDRLCGIDDI